jgi:hypothetical protein
MQQLATTSKESMDWLVTNIVSVLAVAGAVFLLGLAMGALEVFPRWPSRKRWGIAFWLIFIGAAIALGILQSGPGGKAPINRVTLTPILRLTSRRLISIDYGPIGTLRATPAGPLQRPS